MPSVSRQSMANNQQLLLKCQIHVLILMNGR